MPDDLAAFTARVWQRGEELYRDLPWRRTQDPYEVLVSEVMLQQTQVKRVLNYWPRFLHLFPTLDALAAADTSVVLEAWQGLGYNRRALALKRCAETCARAFAGTLPTTHAELLALDGIGPATAGGILAFAHNRPAVYLETNVRTVFLHELFTGAHDVPDKELIPLIEATCSQDNPRGWYYALLDYGSYLKQTIPNPSRRSKHHAKQSVFEGSRRQKRAELIRLVLACPGVSFDALCEGLAAFEAAHKRSAPSRELVRSLVDDLLREGFFVEDNQTFRCP